MSIKFSNLYDLLEKNTSLYPNKIAIYDDDIKISYIKLKTIVDKLALFLSSLNINDNDKIAIIMPNSYQFIVALFAINKIGCIAIPINSFLKEEELAYIVNDSSAKVIISSGRLSKEVANLPTKTQAKYIIWSNCEIENNTNFNLDNIFTKELNIKAEQIATNLTSAYMHKSIEDTMIIVYTSGTTGKPKGAMLCARNIFSNCNGTNILMDLNGRSLKMIAYLPMFHAFTLTANIILPLYTCGSVIVVKSINSIKDFKYVLKQLLFKRCEFFTGVPEIYNILSRTKLPWYFHWFHNVRGFISGAAALSTETYKKFTSIFKRGHLIQGYGISECSPIVSCNTPEHNKMGSVGRPLSGYKVKIVDDNMNVLPCNSIGEICVHGDCVMQGYYNKPEDTKDAIIDGWFKTGDLGYLDEDGFIFIVDRKKDIIINKGVNIYPREIEEVLYQHPAINVCAVIGAKDKDETEIPIAYIELKENTKTTIEEIRTFLNPHLATFKMPRKFIFIDKIPKNSTGKILKRELRDLYNTSKPPL